MRQTSWLRLISLILVAAVISLGYSFPGTVEVGKPVADFSLKDFNGKNVKLSDFKGKVVVLEWTNPNCPFVQRVYRQGIMTSVQKSFAEKGIVWLAVNSTNPEHRDFESAQSLKKTYDDWKAFFTTMLLDPDGKVGRTFNARTTPHMFIINERGKLVYNGAIDDDPRGNKSEKTNYVKACLTELFEGNEITHASTTPYGCSVKY